MFYEEVFRRLYRDKIRYLVVGGVAVNLYGILRATADLDLILDLEAGDNVAKFIAAVKELGYRPRVPVAPEELADPKKRDQWRSEKGAVVFTFLKPNSYEQIDVFLHEPFSFVEAYKKRKGISISDFEITVASLEDLKALKERAGRGKDLSDLAQIEKLKKLEPND
jgi:hypothetical protein